MAVRYRRLPGLRRRGVVEPLAARMPALADTRLALELWAERFLAPIH